MAKQRGAQWTNLANLANVALTCSQETAMRLHQAQNKEWQHLARDRRDPPWQEIGARDRSRRITCASRRCRRNKSRISIFAFETLERGSRSTRTSREAKGRRPISGQTARSARQRWKDVRDDTAMAARTFDTGSMPRPRKKTRATGSVSIRKVRLK